MSEQLTNREKRIPRVLFLAILFMQIPFIISYHVLENSSLLLPLLTGSYVGLVLMLFFTFYNGIKNYHLITIGFIVIQLLPLYVNSMKGIEINIQDYIGTVAKTLNFFLFFCLLFSVGVKKQQLSKFMKYIVWFALLACMYNFIIHFSEIINLRYITSGYELDLKSFFVNRNQFGAFLFISIVAHYYLVSGKKIQLYTIIIFFIQLSNLLLTMSRGAILASAVFFAILYVQHVKNIKVITVMIAIVMAVLVFFLSSEELVAFLTNNILRLDSGVAGRSEIWEMGLTILRENNIINGVGYFTGIDLAKAQGFQFDEFHSLYIDTLVSGGIIELIFLLSLMIYIVRRCLKQCYDRGYKKIYIASFLGILILGFFESLSFFTLGYVGTLLTVFYISIPILLGNMEAT
ncbi:O-antigen ligase family protein [Bacillus spongiae]|uniref:O-antigen ligase family protein n=1 Tax=Bacillus spongiae TaxID=2683610 RepID=A0ABU8HDY3_9BACI